MHARVLRRLLIVLLLVTIAALAWDEFGLNTSLVIDARSPFALTAVDDRGNPDGRSVASVSRTGGALALDCQISTGHEPPSCEMRVNFRQAPAGVDLSRYDSMRLWVTAAGPEAQQRVRLLARNYDPNYSRPGNTESQKVNQLVYEPSVYPPGYEVPLGRFDVAPAWIDEHPMTLDLEAPDFRNVTMLALATGPRVEPGLHRIRVERIELRGRAIATATFRLGLVALWVFTVSAYLVADGLLMRNQLRLSTVSQSSLQRLNESLLVETRSLAEIARSDPLTGVLNRKGLADELLRLVRMGGDSVFPLALVFIDIDRFKRINDAHGHEVGDQVIKGLVALVRSAVQRGDLFARWGGEEFLLVFHNTTGLDAGTIAERLRERIAEAQWPEQLRLTCSFGVAEWHRGEELNDGVRRADEAMYRAKQNGRDRVEMELGPQPQDCA